MKKLTFILFVLFLKNPILSQEYSMKFGVISQNEFDLKTYKEDPEAEAVVLFDIGKSIFYDTNRGYNIRFTRTRRIKILSKAGIDNSEISIPFYVDGYGKTENIVSIEAYTYNFENGKLEKTPLNKSTIYEEKINSRWMAKKFAFPNVKEGSVIEYKYILETPFVFNLPDWTFQDRIPTVYSEYKVSMIPFYEYNFIVQGITEFDHKEVEKSKQIRTFGSVSKSYGQNVGNGFEFQDMIYTFVLKNVPAFKNESFITSIEDYIYKMDFQLAKIHRPNQKPEEIISTWEKLNEGLLKNSYFGGYLKKSKKIAAKILVSDINIYDLNTFEEKSKAIINYVRSAYSWNGKYSKFTSKSPKEFYTEKSGNTADINLFLTALLNEANIDASPVILSTRGNGKIKADYPFSHFFNYVAVLCSVPERSFLTDGTESLLPFDKVPPRCLNEKGLVIKDGKTSWIDLNKNTLSVENKTIDLTIDPENSVAKANISIETTNFKSLEYKNSYLDDTIKLKNEFIEDGFSKINKINTQNYKDYDQPYIINFEGESSLNKISEKLIISPFFKFPLEENILTQKKRSYPVDFMYLRKESLSSTIHIPDNYQVFELPEKYELDNELANIFVDYQKNENQIIVTATYSFKKAIYQPKEYARIKYYIDHIVEKFNQQIVLEKL